MTAEQYAAGAVVFAAFFGFLGVVVQHMNSTAHAAAELVAAAAEQSAEATREMLAGKLSLIEDATTRMRVVVNEVYAYSHDSKHELRNEVAKVGLLIDTHLRHDHPDSELSQVRRAGDLDRLIEMARSKPSVLTEDP